MRLATPLVSWVLSATWIVTVTGSLFLCQSTSGYEIRGKLTAEPKSIAVEPSEYEFCARVAENRWSIRVEPVLRQPSPAGISYYEDAFDGTFSYHYVQFLSDSSSKAVNTSQGIIDTNCLPCEGSPFAPIIWLAYCSSDYFQRASRSEIRQIFDTGVETALFNIGPRRIVTRLHNKPPRLPEAVTFFTDGLVPALETDRILTTRLPPPFDKGYISAKFTAREFTNCGALWFPRSFSLDSSAPKFGPAATSNDVRVVVAWRGHANYIDPDWHGDEHAFVPHTDGAVSTEDRRVPPLEYTGRRVSYLNTNVGKWVPLTNRRFIGTYQALKRNEEALKQTAKPPMHPVAKAILALLVSSLLFVPIIAVERFWGKK